MTETALVNTRQLFLGALVLTLGVLVYVVARPAGSVAFLPANLSAPLPLSPAIRMAAGPLPTLAHAFAFCLFSAGVVSSRHVRASVICASWFVIEAAFEIGQQHRVSAWLTPRVPAWFDHVWLLANTRTYFARGTFDPMDIAAGAVGASMAFLVIAHTSIRDGDTT